jgi:hypothetical protein
MTHSCLTCTDYSCDKVGQDLRACEHYTQDEDYEVLEAVDPNPLDAIVFDLAEKVDALQVEFDKLASAIDDIFSAIVRARSGAER